MNTSRCTRILPPASCYSLRMLTLRRSVVGVVAVLLVGTGCSSPSQTETPAVVASTPPSPKTGTFVINPQFDRAWSFSEGLAAVRIGGKWGFIAR